MGRSVFPLIEKWTEPEPTSLEILEVTDFIKYTGLSSGFTLLAFSFMFEAALKREGKTKDEIIKETHWRKKGEI